MYQNYWEVLAEFYIARDKDYADWDKHNYCMCSRVVVGSAEPIVYNANEVCMITKSQFDDIDRTADLAYDFNNVENNDFDQCRCSNGHQVLCKTIHVCELDCTVLIYLVCKRDKKRIKVSFMKIKSNAEVLDGFDIFLKTKTKLIAIELLGRAVECHVLQDKEFISNSLLNSTHNVEIFRYNLLKCDNIYQMQKYDLVSDYKLLNDYKISDYLFDNCLLQLNYTNFWIYHGDYIAWLTWIFKYKNFIDSDYLNQLFYMIDQINYSTKVSKIMKYIVLKQMTFLKNEIISRKCMESLESTGSLLEINVEEKSNDNENYVDTNFLDNQVTWENLWQNHYQEQYILCYMLFKNYCTNQINLLHKICLLTSFNYLNINNLLSKTVKNKLQNSVNLLLKNLSMRFELKTIYKVITMKKVLPDNFNENSLKDCENYNHCNKDEIEASSFTGLNQIKETLKSIGFSCEYSNYCQLQGEITYKKKNIKYLNKILKIKKPFFYMTNSTNNHMDISQSDKNMLNVMDDCQDTVNENLINQISGDNGFVDSTNIVYEMDTQQKDMNEEQNNTCTLLESQEKETQKLGVSEKSKETKKKSKKRKNKKSKKVNNINVPECVQKNPELKKYFAKRYRLFSKFDNGIILDDESWFSVTPEKIAKHLAERCRSDLLLDPFCGAGGNVIQFAFTCERVYAIDIDPKKIAIARHNARIYGVENRIEFIIGDFCCIADRLFGDVVFLSPPWGGPSYSQESSFDMENIMPPLGGVKLFEMANKISNNVAYYLPKNINALQLAMTAGQGSKVELEQNFLGTQLVAVTAYFGDLISS